MERKTFKFEIKQVDEEEGIIEGYGSTFSKTPDSYGDIVDEGAFTKTIKDNSGNIVSLFNHYINDPIGKPDLSVDKKGLYAKIKIVRGVQKAEETLLLAKAGVITQMSIGYNTIKESWEKGIRHLQEVRLFDVSPVVFAANPEAVIVGVKAATAFTDLPLADREKAWDAAPTEKRVRAWAGGEDNMNWNKYRQAFFWYDSEDPDLFGSYKLGYADIINNRLTAIPRGIFAVAGVLMGARGGVAIPEADILKVKSHVEKYYAKMSKEFEDEDIVAPWNKAAPEPNEPKPFNAQEWVNNALEDILAQMDELEKQEKAGRVLSGTNLDKVKKGLEALQAGLEALQALLEAAESEPEPAKATLLSKEVAEEAARIEAAIGTLKANPEGVDTEETKEAEERIEALLDKMRK